MVKKGDDLAPAHALTGRSEYAIPYIIAFCQIQRKGARRSHLMARLYPDAHKHAMEGMGFY